MKRAALCIVALAAVGTVGIVAQNRPNFSGVWIDVETDSQVLTVKHDATVLTYQVDPFFGATVNMDGSQTQMPLPDGNALLVKGAWEGTRLVVTYFLPEAKQDIRRLTWTLDNGQLVIVTEFFGPAWMKPTPPTKEVFRRRQAAFAATDLRSGPSCLIAWLNARWSPHGQPRPSPLTLSRSLERDPLTACPVAARQRYDNTLYMFW